MAKDRQQVWLAWLANPDGPVAARNTREAGVVDDPRLGLHRPWAGIVLADLLDAVDRERKGR